MTDKEQDEKQIDYVPQSEETEPDYALQTETRRKFLKTVVAVGLGGILLGKKALAGGLDQLVGEEEGLKKVTGGHDTRSKDNSKGEYNCMPGPGVCDPEKCSPCEPHCNPNDCRPNCHPECGPHSVDNNDLKKVTNGHDCYPGYCSPTLPTPDCNPDDCHPECHPQCNPHSCNPS